MYLSNDHKGPTIRKVTGWVGGGGGWGGGRVVAYKRKFIGIYMYFFYSQLNARKEHTMMLPMVPAKIARLITSALWRVQQCVNNALVTRPLWKRYPKPPLVIMFFSMLYVFCKKVVINSYIGRLDLIS